MKPVFLFRVEKDGNVKFVVYTVLFWDYDTYDARWTDDPLLEGNCLTLDIDIVDQAFVFEGVDNEQAALRKVAELYAEQLKEQSN